MKNGASQSLIVIALLLLGSTGYCQESFDLVLHGGRVMDPESGLDGIYDVGIRDGKIVALSEAALSANQTLDVSGLVVAPGFIDLHAHGQDNNSNSYQARDGVTTALDLESGAYPVEQYYKNRDGNAILNYGVSSGHIPARINVSDGYSVGHGPTFEVYSPWYMKVLGAVYVFFAGAQGPGSSLKEELDEAQVKQLQQNIEAGLDAGGIGVGFGLDYTPGSDDDEIRKVFEVAAKHHVPCFVHMKGVSSPTDMSSMETILGHAEATGAALHVMHVTSVGQARTPRYLEMIDAARERGMDVTVEAYPYIAGSTTIESAFFDEGWQERLGISYGDLQWSETGERLTAESFRKYREDGGLVIIYAISPEIVQQAMANPLVMIASDGLPMLHGGEHPRGAGTFARVLGYYSRESGVISLMDALGKMTIMPAKRLEEFVPAMRHKGRMKVGADADITVFDPSTVIDKATFENSYQFSEGIEHVLVAGTFVVRVSENVPDVYPGQAIRASK